MLHEKSNPIVSWYKLVAIPRGVGNLDPSPSIDKFHKMKHIQQPLVDDVPLVSVVKPEEHGEQPLEFGASV